MPDPKNLENLPEILRFNHWVIPDPGPPWMFDILGKEQLVATAVNTLQVQKEVLAALTAGIDRQLAILSPKR
jgi:hypothetical protein